MFNFWYNCSVQVWSREPEAGRFSSDFWGPSGGLPRQRISRIFFTRLFSLRLWTGSSGGQVTPFSSLHNIILNTFRVVSVLWRLLEFSRAFSFMCHSYFEKKFLWRLNISFFRTSMTYERESSTQYNSLHNTEPTQNVFNIILWRLLFSTLFYFQFSFTSTLFNFPWNLIQHFLTGNGSS